MLDLLRALAANLVLIDHSSIVYGLGVHGVFGELGVTIFFILSGFLIERSSLSRLRREGPYFVPFMIDRFARIFTAFIPVLLMVAAINSLVDLGRWGQQGTSTGIIPLFGNLFLLQDYPAFQIFERLIGHTFYLREYNTAEPFWTIPIEFWIYAIFALFVFGLLKGERISRPMWWGLCLVAAPVVIWNAAAGGGNGLSLVWLLGAVAGYVWATLWHDAPQKLRLGIVVGLAAAVCLIGRGLKNNWHMQDLGMVIAEVLALLALLSIMEALPTLSAWLRKPAEFIASYSYSLYLAHNTVLVLVLHYMQGMDRWAQFAVGVFAAHAVAIAVYWLFERHYPQVAAMLKRLVAGKSRVIGAAPVDTAS